MNDKILVVDDEEEIAELVALYLRNENYEVFTAHTASEAMARIGRIDFDLAVLDVMLPDADGLSLCRRIREGHSFPIIMLTAKDADVDKITGLTLGADDYVTKPFRPLELVARVKAQLRRYKRYNEGGGDVGGGAVNGGTSGGAVNGGAAGGVAGGAAKRNEGVIVCSDLIIDSNRHECTLDGQLLALTPTEFSILRILCENAGDVVSSERLFHEIWGDEYYSKSNNTITVHVRHLREKMNDTTGRSGFIKTIWGVGYKVEEWGGRRRGGRRGR